MLDGVRTTCSVQALVNELKQQEALGGPRYMALLVGRKTVSGSRETDRASSAAREGTHRDNQRTRIAAAKTRLLEQLREYREVGRCGRAVEAQLRRGSYAVAERALSDFRLTLGMVAAVGMGDSIDPAWVKADRQATQATQAMQAMRDIVRVALGSSPPPASWLAATLHWLAAS